MKSTKPALLLLPVLIGLQLATVTASELNVSVQGNATGNGSPQNPFQTISAAAQVAQPGDVILVHPGVYRERINPPRGGESDMKRIVYQASPGEPVVITGSELVTNWMQIQAEVWKAMIPNSFFGSFNPYTNLIHGDWFHPGTREHHTGAVYLNGDELTEAATLDEIMKSAGNHAFWFGTVDRTNTTIWAQFKGVNPNRQRVEINVRQTVFYPKKTGINYITVSGFTLEDAATPWAPPTAEQIGLIGTDWSKGWIIESNMIRCSTCAGVSLGKYGDQWDNTSANSAHGYVETIERARTNGWNSATIGHHIVRDNEISQCGQAGIVGSLGCAFSTILHNVIHDIDEPKLLNGAEMAGIKFHGAVDVVICHNHIYRCVRGLWLDWMAQGTRVRGNLFNDNGIPAGMKVDLGASVVPGGQDDLFVEVDHGPFLVDNNIFLSPYSLNNRSQGGAYVHNLFAGIIRIIPFDSRLTPFLKPHSTEVAGLHNNPYGDDRYYNNIFAGHTDLSQYDAATLPVWLAGNVFLDGAKTSKFEQHPLVKQDFDPAIQLVQEANGWHLKMKIDPTWCTARRNRMVVTTELLGRTSIAKAAYEQPDGSPILIHTDNLGQLRNEANPIPGPFANLCGDINVWPASEAQ